MTAATSTSDGPQNTTATGPAAAHASAAFDLTGAKRFVRMVVTPRILATDCGTHLGVTVTGGITFTNPTEAPGNYAKSGRIIVTSACSTST